MQLGILCGDPGSDQTFAYLDFFVECGASNEFAQIDGNFTCTESTSASGEIAEVEIETDYRWALVNDRCYTFKENVTLPPLPPTPLPTSAAPQPTADTTIYSASYTARFKHILDEGCQGPVPEIVVLCETGILEILGTSDPSITCIGPLALNASSAALCSITCVGDECNSVYIDAGATNPDIYGGVIFQCQGPNVNGVKAQAGILGSDTGSCDSGSGSGINVMLVQLGVFCADEGDYIFDDQHAECAYPGSNPINIGGEYHCFSGRVCGGDACSVPINEILVIADHYRFPECIETSDGSVISQIDLPTSEPIAPGSYTGFFASNTRIILSEITSGNDCVVHATGQRVTCVNGNIRLIDPGFMSCEVVADDAIECTELNGVTPTNKWGSVIYVRFGSSTGVPVDCASATTGAHNFSYFSFFLCLSFF